MDCKGRPCYAAPMTATSHLSAQFGPIDIYLFDQLLRGRIAPGMRVLDAGCGPGRNLVYLLRAGYEVFGVDPDPAAIDAVRRLAATLAPHLPPTHFRAEPVEAMTFAEHTADVVLSNAVLHFARDDAHFRAMLHGTWLVLRPGGLFFCRLASSIGMEHRVRRIEGRRFVLPDATERYLVDEAMLLEATASLGGELLDPLKTTIVHNQRCMTTWVVRKDALDRCRIPCAPTRGPSMSRERQGRGPQRTRRNTMRIKIQALGSSPDRGTRRRGAGAALLLLVAAGSLGCGTAGTRPDVLDFYQELTSVKSLYDQRMGELTQLPKNEKGCISEIADASDAKSYYQLNEAATEEDYDTYGKDSAYAHDVARFVETAERLMALFKDSGLLDEIVRRGRTPALMFDVDNTLEFTSTRDSDPTGDGPPIVETVNFSKKYCFKDGVSCYFVTARPCRADLAESTAKWIENTFGLTAAEVEKHTFLMGSVSGCAAGSGQKIAYKDIVRQALLHRDGAFWLMSVGDQLTDFWGEHSGLKLWVPNQLFHSNVVPNPTWEPGCERQEVLAPTASCSEKIVGDVLALTRLPFCSACTKEGIGCYK